MKYAQVSIGCTLIRIIDSSENTIPLDEQVTPYLCQHPNLLLDMENVNLTSIMIGELVNLMTSLRKHWNSDKPKIRLINLNDQGQRVLQTTKLDQEFSICESLDQAYKSFSNV